MHVLTIPAWWPSNENPIAGNFVPHYAHAFVRAGIACGVVYPNLIGPAYWRRPGVPLRPRLVNEQTAGVPVVRIRGMHTALRQPALQMWRYERWLRRGLHVYQRQHGLPDVLHAHCAIPAGWAALRLGAELRRPVVITEHTGPFELALRPPAARRYTMTALAQADAVVAVSSMLAEQMRTAGASRAIQVIPNPVGERFRWSPPPPVAVGAAGRPAYHVAFVGRLVRDKGVYELADAVEMLRRNSGFSVHWHVVGEGPAAVPLRERLGVHGGDHVMKDRTGAPDRPAPGGDGDVSFWGLQDAAGVARVLSASHLLVLPSHWENCPLAVAEGLCVGRPVVATAGTGCAEMVGDGDGLLHAVGDARGLCNQIEAALQQYSRWDSQEIARRAAQRYAAEHVAGRYAAIFASLPRER